MGGVHINDDDEPYHRMEDQTHDDQMIRTRHHKEEVHDEYSQGGMDGNDDGDTDDDNDGYNNQNYNTRNYQAHRQNDRDEPHNGNRYYYVDENNI